MVQVPADTPTMVLPLIPDTIQTLGVTLTKKTGLPEAPPVALAVVIPPRAKVDGVKMIGPMLCSALPITMVITWMTLPALESVTVSDPAKVPVANGVPEIVMVVVSALIVKLRPGGRLGTSQV